MKPKSVLQVKNNPVTTQSQTGNSQSGTTNAQANNAATNQNSPSKSQKVSAFFKKAFSKKLEDWNVFLLFAIAVGVAILGRYVATRMLEGSEIGFVWQELIKDLLAFLLLGAFASISHSSKIGTAVFLLIVALSISVLARHDYTYTFDRSSKEFMVLSPGNYEYDLKAGEATHWRDSRDHVRSGIGFSSDTYDYDIIFSDGTSYPGGLDTKIPVKGKGVWFRVKARSAQKLYVTIN